MKRSIIIGISIIGLLIIWHIRTLKRHIADTSGYFNSIITVCIPYTYAVKSHNAAALNAGAQCAYKRFAPSENLSPQQCYIKFLDDPKKRHPHLPYGHYQSADVHGTQADAHLDGILQGPYNIYFNNNNLIQKQMNNVDIKAHSAKSIQEAINILQKK